MGMSLRQIRYLYAIGVFKRDGSKGRLGKSKPVEGPARQITKQLNQISSTLKVGEVSPTHRLRVGDKVYPIQKDKNGSSYPSVKGKTRDISSLPAGKVSIERTDIRVRKVTKPSKVSTKTETAPDLQTLLDEKSSGEQVKIGKFTYTARGEGKNRYFEDEVGNGYEIDELVKRHQGKVSTVSPVSTEKSLGSKTTLTPHPPGKVDKSILKGITSSLVRLQVRDRLEFEAALTVLDPARLDEKGYSKSIYSQIESDWAIEKKAFKLGQPMPTSILGALEFAHAYELRRVTDPHADANFDLAQKAHGVIVEYGELRADQMIREMSSRDPLSVLKKYSGEPKTLIRGKVPESQVANAKTTQDFLNTILSSQTLPSNFEGPTVVKNLERGDYGSRSSYIPLGHQIRMTEGDDGETMIHEAGHALESDSKTWDRAHQSFISQFFDRSNVQKLSTLTGNRTYLDSEEAYTPKKSRIVSHPYIGKVNNAETISMGFEALFRNADRFRRDYPEHFRYIIAITQTPHSLRRRK